MTQAKLDRVLEIEEQDIEGRIMGKLGAYFFLMVMFASCGGSKDSANGIAASSPGAPSVSDDVIDCSGSHVGVGFRARVAAPHDVVILSEDCSFVFESSGGCDITGTYSNALAASGSITFYIDTDYCDHNEGLDIECTYTYNGTDFDLDCGGERPEEDYTS